MSAEVTAYREAARAFQIATEVCKESGAKKANRDAKQTLQTYAGFAKDWRSYVETYVHDEAAKGTLLRKFAKWEKENGAPAEDRTYHIIYFTSNLLQFVETYRAPAMKEVRTQKRGFQWVTFKKFEEGKTVNQLREQLAGHSGETLAKVGKWFVKYQALKANGGLEAKMRALANKIAG